MASHALKKSHCISRYIAFATIVKRTSKFSMSIRIIILKKLISFNALRMVELVAIGCWTFYQLSFIKKGKRIINQDLLFIYFFLLFGGFFGNIYINFEANLTQSLIIIALAARKSSIDLLLKLIRVIVRFLNFKVNFVLILPTDDSPINDILAFCMKCPFAIFLAKICTIFSFTITA